MATAQQFVMSEPAAVERVSTGGVMASAPERDDARRLCQLAVDLLGAKRKLDALAAARAAVNFAPRDGTAWNVLAAVYNEIEDGARSMAAAAREATLLAPADPSTWHNLSLGLMRSFDLVGAIDAAAVAVSIRGGGHHFALQGAFLASLIGAHQLALDYLDVAEDRCAGDPGRGGKLSEILLWRMISSAQLRDWDAFCKYVERRHEQGGPSVVYEGGRPPERDFLKTLHARGRLWTQTDNGTDREALVYLEWGMGDQIQFARLIPDVLRYFGCRRVTVACSKPLVKLMRTLAGADNVIDNFALDPDALLPDVAVIPVMDLMIQAHRLGMFPPGAFHGSYLKVPAAPRSPVRRWRPAREPGKKAIAFCWQGDPRNGTDFIRRIPLAAWGEFARAHSSQFTFHSVQTMFAGYGEPWAGWPEDVPVEDCSPFIRDYADAARVIAECDVFVGQCGGYAHLAGAIGAPAVVMLGASHDWRWDAGTLYDVELVCQKQLGDWGSAFEQLEGAIEKALTRPRPEFQEEEK